jgi:hypothetical protein
VPISTDVQPVVNNHDGILWNDRAYQDMNDPRFTSRTQHREYMKANGLTTVDDYKEQWAKQAKDREQFYHGIDPGRREEIIRALERKRG